MFTAVDHAAAQTPTPAEQVDGDIKGTIGLGLIGLEVGLLLPPLFKLQDEIWAWTVFPVVGAAGGTVAGIFAFEQGTPDRRVTIPIFAAGVALVIPAIVGSLAIKARRDSRAGSAEYGGSGLIRLGNRGTRLGVPAVGATAAYSDAEQRRYGARQRSQFGVSLLSGRF
jgi:hypothetical protein